MENQASLRELNDRVYRSLQRTGAEGGDFACECEAHDCEERVERLLIEYAAREGQPLLAPGHEASAPD